MFFFQIQVEAYDSYWPNNRAFGTLTINVVRNPNGPRFIRDPFTETILADFGVGQTILTLEAEDLDKVSITVTYFIINQFKTFTGVG